jgi:lysozyme
MTREINEAGLDLIKDFEGCRLTPYRDSAGFLTVGIGHKIRPGEHYTTITMQQAYDLLEADLESARASVERLVKVPLINNQFAALVSFTFNLGAGALSQSTLLKLVNAGQFARAADEFVKWNKARVDGVLQPLPGLTRRREAEAQLFITPDQPDPLSAAQGGAEGEAQ